MVADPNNTIALGIDFGTSECRGVVLSGAEEHELRIPSLVAVDPQGGLVAGSHAAKVAERHAELGVESIKRLLGRRVGSPEIEWLAAGTPQVLMQTERGIGVQLAGSIYSAPALAHALLRHVVEQAERAVRPAPKKRRHIPAVLTIPAMFDMPQRLALVRLARHAGMQVERVVESPLAALTALRLPKSTKRVAVADFGAGYFDICMAERVADGWQVIGSEGDTLLGTDDLDQRVSQMLIESFYAQHAVDLSQSARALGKLRRQARRIRKDARKRQPGATVLTNLVKVRGKDLPLVHPPLNARDLEALWDEELSALVPPCLRLFEALGLGTDDVDTFVLLGGGALLPFVQARFQNLMRRAPMVPTDGAALAGRGAATLAAGSGPVARSVVPHTLSVRAGQRAPVPVTHRNQPVPFESTHFFKPDDPHRGPIDLWLCQGEQEHGYDALRVARAHLEHAGDGSYVVTIGVNAASEVTFSVQPSAVVAEEGMSERPPSEPPPMSEGTPQIVVDVDGMDEDLLRDYMASLAEEEDDDDIGGQPTIAARRVEPEEAPAPSSRPERPLRRSMFGRAQVAEVVAATKLPLSATQIEMSGPASMRTTADPIVGMLLGGRYEVTSILGEGAMARVYKARHKILGSSYAIKVMHPALASDASLRERFLREARAAAAIDSDHVVRILDFGKADDERDYFVMEYLEGSSLEDEIQKGLVSMPVVTTAMTQVARGLEAAHEHKIVHRDLKPENVWLTQVGDKIRAKILDFGVAKIPTAEAGLTMGNSIIGTPYYMAPEQVTGEVDTRTDIYAMGIIMFELVTGRLPFHHESLAFVLAMHCDMPLPSPRELAGPVRCSDELDRVIRKCAEKAKEDRYQTAAELRSALEKLRSA